MENSETAPAWLKTRLSIQMFLQFASWGAWAPVLTKHLHNIGFADDQIGGVFAAGSFATMISPLIAGQIADRWFPTQIFIAVSYLITGVLFFIAQSTTSYTEMYWLGFGTMLFFSPTLGLANSLCFHHLSDPRRNFPFIRAFGTVGWIAAGIALNRWMIMSHRPIGDCLALAGVFSIVNAVYSMTLPNTPPRRNTGEPFALGKVLAMLKEPSFAVFCFLSFMLLVFGNFYYVFAGRFLPSAGISDENLSLVMLIGQVTEILTMFILPLALMRLGSKTTICIGVAAWAIRFSIFAVGQPLWFVVAAQALHGVAFAFAIAAAMIYVERICTPDVRGSMQSFLAWLTYGLGGTIGSLLGGRVSTMYTVDKVTDWHKVLMVPAIGCATVLLLFIVAFRARDTEATAKSANIAAQPAQQT
jgi:nucleoside transporter